MSHSLSDLLKRQKFRQRECSEIYFFSFTETVSVIESIPTEAFTASSTLDEQHSSYYAVIGKTYEDGSPAFWAPASDDTDQYLQIDMGQPTQLSTVETQGAAGRFVTTFLLRYSVDGVTWITYKGDDGEDMVLKICQY